MVQIFKLVVRISDLKLLQILRENSRTPLVKIARVLGVSETAIRKRLKKLESEGVIKKYTVVVDPKKIGFEAVAFIGVDTRPENYLAVLEMLKGREEVVSLYSTSGDHMILAECWFRNSEKLSEFIRELEKVDGITRICPAIILERIK